MEQAKNGDQVKVHYTGKLVTGEQFDSSEGREPLAFTVGAGQMIKGFDAAIPGMNIGDKKTVTIPAAEAYGERNPQAIIEFSKANIPAEMVPELKVGMQVTLTNPQGQPVPVIVAEIKEEVVILDANHFLAGQDLVFDIELVEIGGSRIITG